MRDATKEIKINLPMYHFRMLQLWAFVKSIPYSQLVCNIAQARIEDKGNQHDIEAGLALRAPQAPYNTTPDDLKRQIWGEEDSGDNVAIPVDIATYRRLVAIAAKQNKTIEEYISEVSQDG